MTDEAGSSDRSGEVVARWIPECAALRALESFDELAKKLIEHGMLARTSGLIDRTGGDLHSFEQLYDLPASGCIAMRILSQEKVEAIHLGC